MTQSADIEQPNASVDTKSTTATKVTSGIDTIKIPNATKRTMRTQTKLKTVPTVHLPMKLFCFATWGVSLVTAGPKCDATMTKLEKLREESIPRWKDQWDKEDILTWIDVGLGAVDAFLSLTPFDGFGKAVGVGSAVLGGYAAHTGIVVHDRISLELANIVADMDECFEELNESIDGLRQYVTIGMEEANIKQREKDRLIELRKLSLYRKAMRVPCTGGEADYPSWESTCCTQAGLSKLWCGDSTHNCVADDLATCNGKAGEVQDAWWNRLTIIGCLDTDTGLFRAVKEVLDDFVRISGHSLTPDNYQSRSIKLQMLMLLRGHLHVVFEALRNAIRDVMADQRDTPTVRGATIDLKAPVCGESTVSDYLEKAASMLVDLHHNYFGVARNGRMQELVPGSGSNMHGVIFKPLSDAVHAVLETAMTGALPDGTNPFTDDDWSRASSASGFSHNGWTARQADKYCANDNAVGMCVQLPSWYSGSLADMTDYTKNDMFKCSSDPSKTGLDAAYHCNERNCKTVYQGDPSRHNNRLSKFYCSDTVGSKTLLPGFLIAYSPDASPYLPSNAPNDRRCHRDFQLFVPTQLQLYQSNWAKTWKHRYVNVEHSFCPQDLDFRMFAATSSLPNSKVTVKFSDLEGTRQQLCAKMVDLPSEDGHPLDSADFGPGKTLARVESALFGDPKMEAGGNYMGTWSTVRDPTAPLALYWPFAVSRSIDSLVQVIKPDKCPDAHCPPKFVHKQGQENHQCKTKRCFSVPDQIACCIYAPPPSCFEASTTFTSREGTKRADALKVGDEVLVMTEDGAPVWDTIAMAVSHGQSGRLHEYRHIVASDGRSLRISPNHYLHARKPGETFACCSASTLLPAGQLQIGDTIWVTRNASTSDASVDASTTPAVVAAITTETHPTAYNFLLLQEDVKQVAAATGQPATRSFYSLIANGVVASSFTEQWRLMKGYGPYVADRLGDPVRALYRAGLRLESDQVDGSSGILKLNHGSNVSAATSPLNNTIFAVAVELENLIADCFEAHMHSCSEAAVNAKVDALLANADQQIPPSVLQAVIDALEPDSYVARGVRRLASVVVHLWAGNQTALVTTVVGNVVRTEASLICDQEPSCAADKPYVSTLLPHWAVALIILLSLLLLAAFCLLIYLLYRCGAFQRKEATKAKVIGISKETTASADVAGKCDTLAVAAASVSSV